MIKKLITLALILFFDVACFGIILPSLPFYAQKHGASGTLIGALMMGYALMQFVMSPVWGSLSDRIGRRPVLLISTLGGAVSMAVMAVAESFHYPLALLFAGRLLAGICGGNISTAYAYVADATPPEKRTMAMGILGAALGLGFTLGPAIGGLLVGENDYSRPMIASAMLGGANFVLAFFFLKEVRVASAKASPQKTGFAARLETLRFSLTLPVTGKSIILYFLFTLAMSHLEMVFALFFNATYGFGARENGYLMFAAGMMMVAVQGGFVGKLAKRWGEVKLVSIGGVLCVIGLGVVAYSNQFAVAFAGLVVLSFSRGILHPSLSSLASLEVSPDRRGAVMGIFHSGGSLARVLGPIMAGFLYDQVGHRSPFVSASLIMVLMSLIAIYSFSTKRLPQWKGALG